MKVHEHDTDKSGILQERAVQRKQSGAENEMFLCCRDHMLF